MNATKYDGYDPNRFGPNVYALYDMLNKRWIDPNPCCISTCDAAGRPFLTQLLDHHRLTTKKISLKEIACVCR